MCWCSNEFNLLTALEDIPIKKVVSALTSTEKLYFSIYRNFLYFKGKKAKTGMTTIYPKIADARWARRYNVEENALHSYIPECKVVHDISYSIINILTPKMEVELDWFHANEVLIVEGVVPKGAKYAINEFGECISTELILY